MLNQRVTCRIAKIISISLCALMLIACERSAPGSSSHADSFEKQQLNGHDFRGANLAGAKFDGAVLVGANFVGANLKGASFKGADLRDFRYRHPCLAGTHHSSADGAAHGLDGG